MIEHIHNGIDARKVSLKNVQRIPVDVNNFLQENTLLFSTVTDEPSDPPANFLEQVQLFDDTAGSGDIYLYFYDSVGEAWIKFLYTV